MLHTTPLFRTGLFMASNNVFSFYVSYSMTMTYDASQGAFGDREFIQYTQGMIYLADIYLTSILLCIMCILCIKPPPLYATNMY
jgi:hypothetical protein